MDCNELLDFLPCTKKDALSINEISLIIDEHRQSVTRKINQLIKYGFICCIEKKYTTHSNSKIRIKHYYRK